ncbi:MAG: hypothetical protein WCE36_23080 [Pseudolabrys sp.]
MTEQILGTPKQVTSPIRTWYVFASVVALAAMFIAIEVGSNWVLNFVHVMCGGLWTGVDLFMGFVIGPILRHLPLEARRAVIAALVPRTLFLMPTLSIITATSGWFLAERTGFLDLNYPEFWWVVASLVIVAVLTVQGLGYLLPANLRIYFELQKPTPNLAMVARWMRVYFGVVASQGAMQVAIIIVMARFATGL